MTVGSQMEKAIAGIQSAASTMKTFALETEDQQAKKDYQQIAQQLDDALVVLEGRRTYIQEQEPQYRQQ